MLMGLFLCLILLILLGINYIIFNRDYIAPSFIFNAALCVAAMDCTFNLYKWDTGLSGNTVFVICLSVFSFLLFSVLAQWLYKNSRTKVRFNKYAKKMEEIRPSYYKCSKIFCSVFLVIQIIVALLVINQIYFLTTKYVSNGNIAASIAMYQHLIKNTTLELKFPKLITYFFLFTTASGYIWGYIIVYNFCYFKKIDRLVVMNFVVSCASGILTGSRGNSLQMFVSIIIIYIIILNKNQLSKAKKFKTLVKILLILVVLLLLFETIAGLIGRDNSLALNDYLSVYIGAPIKNLDIFLETGYKRNDLWGGDTFQTQIQWVSEKVGWIIEKKTINVEYTYLNGYNLGNVYTAFKDYYNDFGYVGIIFCNGFIAFFLQYLYEKIKMKKFIYRNTMSVSFELLIYAYLFFAMAFTFFSNKFYEAITITFVERIFFWWVLVKAMSILKKIHFRL
ncbi:O-antigen polymerase [Clostridium sp. AN503]|uniref:O-antigen polymerase n=1 Tax=Clostridium sp. AN503 TaxID=3160598 RepID=UPI003459C3F9